MTRPTCPPFHGTGAQQLVVSVSGGKDSTATMLHLRDMGLPFRAVTFDTGWEHRKTYEYLDYLRATLGVEIESFARYPKKWGDELEAQAREVEALLGPPWFEDGEHRQRSAMVRWTLSRGMFPSRIRRFCTQELKVFTSRDVNQAVAAAGLVPVNVLGIRAAESVARAKLPEVELAMQMDAYVWRPLIAWSTQDVVDIHARHGIRPNPLYLEGAERVGCWPCIQAGKSELRLLARDDRRVLAIERLEALVAERARERGKDGNPPAFFQAASAADGETRPCVPIRTMLEWASTSHGGRQVDLLAGLPNDDGCMRWGLCETEP